MDVASITAVCAIIIAVLSLAVSVVEASSAREHNRKSVRPLLMLMRVHRSGSSWTGLSVRNVGLGPAIVTESIVRVDGTDAGEWTHPAVGLIVGSHEPRPNYGTLRKGAVIPAGGEERLIFIDDSDPARDTWLWDAIVRRLHVEVRYESIYGGEKLSALCEPWHGKFAGPNSTSGQPPSAPAAADGQASDPPAARSASRIPLPRIGRGRRWLKIR
jgi:hypothetical protein